MSLLYFISLEFLAGNIYFWVKSCFLFLNSALKKPPLLYKIHKSNFWFQWIANKLRRKIWPNKYSQKLSKTYTTTYKNAHWSVNTLGLFECNYFFIWFFVFLSQILTMWVFYSCVVFTLTYRFLMFLSLIASIHQPTNNICVWWLAKIWHATLPWKRPCSWREDRKFCSALPMVVGILPILYVLTLYFSMYKWIVCIFYLSVIDIE